MGLSKHSIREGSDPWRTSTYVSSPSCSIREASYSSKPDSGEAAKAAGMFARAVTPALCMHTRINGHTGSQTQTQQLTDGQSKPTFFSGVLREDWPYQAWGPPKTSLNNSAGRSRGPRSALPQRYNRVANCSPEVRLCCNVIVLGCWRSKKKKKSGSPP